MNGKYIVVAVAGIALAMLTTRCGRPTGVERGLRDALVLVESDPARAVAILDSLASLASDNPREAALRALTQTKILYWLDAEKSADSLAAATDAWFSRHGSPHDRAEAKWLRGEALMSQQQWRDAVVVLLEAEEPATKSGDWLLLGRIYRAMADIYNHTITPEPSLRYSRKEHDAFVRAGARDHADWSLLDVVIALHNNRRYDDAQALVDSVKEVAMMRNDEQLLESGRQCESYISLETGQPRRAIDLQMSLPRHNAKDLYTLGRAYVLLGMADSARVCHDAMLAAGGEFEDLTYNLLRLEGNKDEEALQCLEQTIEHQTRLVNSIVYANITGLEDAWHAEQERLRQERLRLTIVLCVVGAVVLLMVGAFYFLLRRRDWQLDQERLRGLYNSTLEVERQLRHSLDTAKQQRNQALIDSFRDINKLCLTYFDTDPATVPAKKVAETTRRIINSYSSPEMMAYFEQQLDNLYPGLLEEFRRDYPQAAQQWGNLFVYIAMGFGTQTIPVLLGISQKAYYSQKARLKAAILNSDTPSAQRLISVLKR